MGSVSIWHWLILLLPVVIVVWLLVKASRKKKP
jgi:hypothetical protein